MIGAVKQLVAPYGDSCYSQVISREHLPKGIVTNKAMLFDDGKIS